MDTLMGKYWKEKVEKIEKIAKEYGYLDYGMNFLKYQPAGLLSLIVDIYDELQKIKEN